MNRAMTETITYLELTDPADLREPSRPGAGRAQLPRGTRSRRSTASSTRRSAALTSGSIACAGRTTQWAAWAAGVETWIAEVDGEPAGYFELRVDRDSTLISIFGIREPYRGKGLGAALLTHAIKRGFELAPPGLGLDEHDGRRARPRELRSARDAAVQARRAGLSLPTYRPRSRSSASQRNRSVRGRLWRTR